jgi:hypothetical protein
MLVLEHLVDFGATGEWRTRVAEQYPEDTRNLEAAELLGHLADQARDIENSPLHHRLEQLYFSLSEGMQFRFGELVSEELRGIGFYSSPDDAADFIEGLISSIECEAECEAKREAEREAKREAKREAEFSGR